MEDITKVIQPFWQTLGDLVIWPYLVVFVFVSYMVIKYFGDFLDKKVKFKKVYLVLIIAFFLGIPYMLSPNYKWDEVLLTYSFGTSFYELIIKRFTKKDSDNAK